MVGGAEAVRGMVDLSLLVKRMTVTSPAEHPKLWPVEENETAQSGRVNWSTYLPPRTQPAGSY